LKKVESEDKTLKDLIWLLYETSLLTSGFGLEDPTTFSGRLYRMIALGLGCSEECSEECTKECSEECTKECSEEYSEECSEECTKECMEEMD